MNQKGFANIVLVVVIIILAGAVGYFLVFQPLQWGKEKIGVEFSKSEAASQPYGWDYNLTKKCVKSTNSSAANYFQDTSQCDSSGKNWTVAVQSEKTYEAGSCPGPINQSFPINSPGSPLSMTWQPHTDELGQSNWSVNLKTDLSANSHPCGSGYFTWFVLMDHMGHGGGPFPRPDQLSFSATVNFSDYVPNGATRGFAAWQGAWDGKARGIELTFQGTNWGDNYPNEPDIVDYLNTSSLEFVHMDGRALGISAPKGVDTKLNIDWSNIIKNLVSRGYLQAPSTGWENTATTDVHVGHESHNWAVSQSVISSLWVTNFRVESTVQATATPTPTSTATPTPTQSSTPTPSPTFRPTPTPTATLTVTPTPSITITPTPTSSPSPTLTPTLTPTPTRTPSPTPKPTPTPTPTPTPFPTSTTTATPSPTISPTPKPTQSPIPIALIIKKLGIKDGDLIRKDGSDTTVWIVKTVDGRGFKRQVFGPQLFYAYEHLGFDKVKTIYSQDVFDWFRVSDLIRRQGDKKVYELANFIPGVGATRHWIPSVEVFLKNGFSFKAVYIINDREFNFYTEAQSR